MEPELTVGWIVHYFPDEDTANPIAAIVTRVWSNTCANLHLFSDMTSARFANADVTSVCKRDEQNRVGVWDWPGRG